MNLYDISTTLLELHQAYRPNDFAVMTAYGFDKKITESECVAELLKCFWNDGGRHIRTMGHFEYELEEQIKYFISRRCETDQWDFKQEWHVKIEDLIKDIICFANTVHNNDCYLVFGISDDYQVVGMSKQRRKQSDILEVLSNLHFAGDILPQIELHLILIDGKEIDVLIIKNTDLTPIYLKKQYGRMKPGCIYTRVGDKNTPNDSNAEYYEIEKLWRKRFGLAKSPLDFIYDSLQNKLNWKDSDTGWYHIYKPEYVIHTYRNEEENYMHRIKDEFYSYSQVNEVTSFMTLDIIANKTVLESYQIACLDSGQLTIPTPEWGVISTSFYSCDNICYKYYTKNTKIHILLSFMYNPEKGEERYAFKHLMNVVLMFESEDERKEFEDYISYNLSDFNDKLSKADRYDYIETGHEKRTEIYKNQLNTGYVLNEMLKEFRDKCSLEY